jgi:hypothetical protein
LKWHAHFGDGKTRPSGAATTRSYSARKTWDCAMRSCSSALFYKFGRKV